MEPQATSSSMFSIPFVQKIQKSQNVLLAGMGGGYDVFTGIPLYFDLKAMGKNPVLANLSFTENLHERACSVDGKEVCEWLTQFTLETSFSKYPTNESERFHESTKFPNNYFPEWHLSKWFFEKHKMDVPIITFDLKNSLTVNDLHKGFEAILLKYSIDTIILIDAGVDSLLRHDEQGLGTFGEDLMTIIATSRCDVPHKYLLTVGLGTEGGISDYDFLENWANIRQLEGWLGSVGLHHESQSVKEYLNAYYACVPCTINAQIIAGIEGHYKHYLPPHIASRGLKERDMFITPHMGTCWFWDLDIVIKYKLFWDQLQDATTLENLQNKLEKARMKAGLLDKNGRYQGQRVYKEMYHT